MDGLVARAYRLARRLLGSWSWRLANAAALAASGLRLVDARREGRPLGVSATVITYNDPDWLPVALSSLDEVADEVVIVDSSDPWDETVKVISDYAAGRGDVKVIRQYPPQGYAAAREAALRAARYRYVLVWDSDFAPFRGFAERLRAFVESYDERRYALVYWPWITLCGDLSHRCRADRYHVEHWMFTHSARLRYLWDGRNEYLYAPPYYFRVWLSREPQGVHLTGVRRPERVAFKRLAPRVSFYELVRARGYEEALRALREEARREYGTDDLAEVGLRMMREEAAGRPCFDASLLPPEVVSRAREIGVPLGSC